MVVELHALTGRPADHPRLPAVADDEPHRPALGRVVVGVGSPQVLAGRQAGGDVGRSSPLRGADLATGGAARPEIAIALMSRSSRGVEAGADGRSATRTAEEGRRRCIGFSVILIGLVIFLSDALAGPQPPLSHPLGIMGAWTSGTRPTTKRRCSSGGRRCCWPPSAARRERMPWPIHLDDFMLMGRVDRGSRPAVWIYKHRDSRRELNLDSHRAGLQVHPHAQRRLLRALHGLPTSAGDLPGRPADLRRAGLVRRAAAWRSAPPWPGADEAADPDRRSVAPAPSPSASHPTRRRRPRAGPAAATSPSSRAAAPRRARRAGGRWGR